MNLDRRYLSWALAYGVAGMALGIFMAATHNYAQHVTHAHILLVGFVLSFIYAAIHKLWLTAAPAGLAKLQFYLHHAGALAMFTGLLLLFGGVFPQAQLDPVLAVASFTVFTAAALMLFITHKANRAAKA